MLDGIWIPQGAEFGGQTLPMPDTRWEIVGNRYVIQEEEGRDEGELVIDLDRTPHALDLVGKTGPNSGKTIVAIFRMRGDLLQLCYDVSGASRRPQTFETAPNSMQLMVRYRRISEWALNQQEAYLIL